MTVLVEDVLAKIKDMDVYLVPIEEWTPALWESVLAAMPDLIKPMVQATPSKDGQLVFLSQLDRDADNEPAFALFRAQAVDTDATLTGAAEGKMATPQPASPLEPASHQVEPLPDNAVTEATAAMSTPAAAVVQTPTPEPAPELPPVTEQVETISADNSGITYVPEWKLPPKPKGTGSFVEPPSLAEGLTHCELWTWAVVILVIALVTVGIMWF